MNPACDPVMAFSQPQPGYHHKPAAAGQEVRAAGVLNASFALQNVAAGDSGCAPMQDDAAMPNS